MFTTGVCVQPAPCGGAGQRACCVGTLEYATHADGSSNASTCNDGQTMVPGCSGDCTCGGTTSLGEPDKNSCTTIVAIAEPTTNASVTPVEPDGTGPGTWTMPSSTVLAGPECPTDGSTCGYADLHVHMFANLAHGGAFIAGEPWDPNGGGVNAALAQDYGSSQNLVYSQGGAAVPSATNPPPLTAPCPAYLDCSNQVLFHADHGLLSNETGGGTNDGAASNLGVPLFNGWPLWTSTVHQQVYYKWLERAWLGGLRLMVMLAVSNEALCRNNIMVAGTNCASSMDSIDLQLTAAQNFQTFLDGQYGGPGQGWFQIVTTPQQAQSVIAQGKLAVVLGIEVDNIFDCHATDSSGTIYTNTSLGNVQEGPNCQVTNDANGNPQSLYLLGKLQKYYGMGVRVIFPVHDFDNAFGKTATWSDAINAGQFEGEGVWQDAVNCAADSGYGFSMSALFDGVVFSIAFNGAKLNGPKPPYTTFSPASCSNGTGTGGSAPITPAGNYLIQQAMNMGFIIDVDHMSIDGFNTTLNMATSHSPVYAGISASHVQFFDLYNQYIPGKTTAGRHERMRTYSQLQQIAKAGGMIGVMLKDDAQDTANGWCLPQGNCSFFGGALGALGGTGTGFDYNYNGPNAPSNNNGALSENCLFSTTETAQQYLYGAQVMNNVGVGLGSDWMGIAGHVGPRFGNGACGGIAAERGIQEFANNRLQYPFTLAGNSFGQQVSGQKIYDFNVDGLAHIGLFPDMIADMKQVGVTDQQLQPLFRSAQDYVTMWSKVYKLPTPDVSLTVPATAAYQSTFTAATNNNQTTTSVPTISVSGVCSISGTTVTMTSGTGTCSVTATWAADPNWGATSIMQTATAATIPPTVSFTAGPGTYQYGTSFAVTATTNASTAAVITVNPGSVCSISNTTVTLTSGTGTCSLTANWAADNNYNSASLNLMETAGKASPSATFTGAPLTDPYASSFPVSATTNASTAAVVTVNAGSVCSISGLTVTMTSGTGACSLTASWAADSNYNATTLSQTTTATKISPAATFTGAPMTDPYGSGFTVATTTHASTAAVISVNAGSVCSISGTAVTMTSGTGACSLTANWATDSNYNSASLTQTTTATKVALTISAINAAITFGQAIPIFTANYSGFVNGQNQSVLLGSPSLTTMATQFSAPGGYTITAALGTLASANYSFPTFNNGTLTINATAAVPPSGNACNGAYQGGTFSGNITVAPNQICEIDGGVVNGNVTSTGGVVILIGAATVNGNLTVSGTATGLGATIPIQVCGATVTNDLTVQSDTSAITLGGTSCGTTSVGGNLTVQSDSGAASITAVTVHGNLTAQSDTGTVLVSGNTVGNDLHVQNNTDGAANATQVLNNNVTGNLVCSGDTSITGQGNTAKSKQGQCSTF